MSQGDPPPTEAQLLQALLATRDIPCPVCAYNLRSNESNNCPECGAALDLRVGSMDLKLGPWLTAMLSVALPLGFVATYTALGLLFNVAMILGGDASLPSLWATLRRTAVLALVCAVYALFLRRIIRQRRKFWARPLWVQWRSAVLYAVLAPGALLAAPLLLFLAWSD
jgi:hypothetical protein